MIKHGIILAAIIFISCFVSAEPTKVFLAELSFGQNNATIENVFVSIGETAPIVEGEQLEVKLIGSRGELFSTSFNLVQTTIIEGTEDAQNQESQSEIIQTTLDRLAVPLPYSEEAVSVQIFLNGVKQDEFDIEHLIDKCNDNICQESENHVSCPNDCPSGGSDGYCDMVQDNICDPDCAGTEPECKQTETPQAGFDLLPIAIVLVIILTAVFIYTRKK